MFKYKFLILYFLIGLFVYLCPIISFANEKQTNNFLVISDIHLDQSSTHKMEINPSGKSVNNDLDPTTFETLVSKIANNIQNKTISRPQFILILGDVVGHIRSASNSVLESESEVFNTISNDFPNTPIFYVFGNNDSFAKNYGPFQDSNQEDKYNSPYNVAIYNAHWKDGFLSTGTICAFAEHMHFPCLIVEDKINGYYSGYLSKKLRFIALNTILFSPKSPSDLDIDAENELKWFSDQLKSAQTDKESVLIAMHIPPGNNIYDHSAFWKDKFLKTYLNIVSIYHHNIIGILASHSHAEEIKILKNIAGKYNIGIYYTAALSTSHANAPSVKTFQYERNKPNKWILSNYITYYFSDHDPEIDLSKLYDFRSYYCQYQLNINVCLEQIIIDKMKLFYSAGNKKFCGIINSPNDLFLKF